MPFFFRKNGYIIEITETEKTPKVRVRSDTYRREPRAVYGVRRRDNAIRARQTCMRRVSAALKAFGNPVLATLTFQGDASDASYANDALRDFQVRLRRKFPEARSIFVPELSPRGRIHFHGLIFNVPVSLGDTRRGRSYIPDGEERKTRTLAKLWGEGFVDVRKTDGSGRLGGYISKYITKGAGELLFAAMRMIRVSGKFPKETRRKGLVAEKLAHQIARKLEPARVWEGQHDFLGKITKKTYYMPDTDANDSIQP